MTIMKSARPPRSSRRRAATGKASADRATCASTDRLSGDDDDDDDGDAVTQGRWGAMRCG